MVREEEKIDRRTAGVTGIRLGGGLGGGGYCPRAFAAVTVGVDDEDVVEGVMVVVCKAPDAVSVGAPGIRLGRSDSRGETEESDRTQLGELMGAVGSAGKDGGTVP